MSRFAGIVGIPGWVWFARHNDCTGQQDRR